MQGKKTVFMLTFLHDYFFFSWKKYMTLLIVNLMRKWQRLARTKADGLASPLRLPAPHPRSQSLWKPWTAARWQCRPACRPWCRPPPTTRRSRALPSSCPGRRRMRRSPGDNSKKREKKKKKRDFAYRNVHGLICSSRGMWRILPMGSLLVQLLDHTEKEHLPAFLWSASKGGMETKT